MNSPTDHVDQYLEDGHSLDVAAAMSTWDFWQQHRPADAGPADGLHHSPVGAQQPEVFRQPGEGETVHVRVN